MFNSPKCPSTHGGSGYPYNSYWSATGIVCGACGITIRNPYPTSYTISLRLYKNWLDRLRGRTWVEVRVPVWPEWIMGSTPQTIVDRYTMVIEYRRCRGQEMGIYDWEEGR